MIQHQNTGTNTKKVGGRNIGFQSLGRIYDMCVVYGKKGKYNGVLIDDIFADEENYPRYSNNLNGFLFNYPTNFKNPHNIVKLNFDNEKECWKYYDVFKGCHHTEPIAIAGIWRPTSGISEAQYECDYESSRQIYVVK